MQEEKVRVPRGGWERIRDNWNRAYEEDREVQYLKNRLRAGDVRVRAMVEATVAQMMQDEEDEAYRIADETVRGLR